MFTQDQVIKALKIAAAKHAKQQKQWNGNSEFRPRIKYFKRLNLFKASNVCFDPSTFEATSYGNGWLFVKVIGGKVVFNNYRYSPSTGQHQRKVDTLLSQLGIKIDVTIEAPRGLQYLDASVSWYEFQIKQLREAMANPRSRNGKNMERAASIKALQAKIEAVQGLIQDQEFYSRKAA